MERHLQQIIRAPWWIIWWLAMLWGAFTLIMPWPFLKGVYYHDGVMGWLVSMWL